MMAISYPSLICILDFLLCIHRFSVMFMDSEFWSTRIRWKGPLIFLSSLPFILFIATESLAYAMNQFGIAGRRDRRASIPLMCFAYELTIKSSLGSLTFIGYLVILMKVIGQSRRVGRTIDFTVIRQALPIASVQFVTNILLLFLHMGNSQGLLSFGKVCTAKYAFTQLLCIVVPFSIILGNRNRREKFGDFAICCRIVHRIRPADYNSTIETTFNSTN
ncbi:unnamed protein product [Caenorhabditis bovis]|uniref:Uncharacterized protein n=1 Tax=Caenorhabditis bovis TaxID=2654633 RepID=A0A8S1EV28_9PELO|nr:unnamed protein product [Caenorhabditis bovis]